MILMAYFKKHAIMTRLTFNSYQKKPLILSNKLYLGDNVEMFVSVKGVLFKQPKKEDELYAEIIQSMKWTDPCICNF